MLYDTDLTDGQTVTLNGPATDTYFTVDDADYYRCTGYMVSQTTAAGETTVIAQGSSATATFTYTAGSTYDVEWFFDKYYKITAQTTGVGTATLSASEQYALAGSTVTLSVSPDAGYELVKWIATENAIENASQEIISFTATATETITAGLWYEGRERVQYVSASGNDENDGLTEATAKANPRTAIVLLNKLKSTGTVNILPGSYTTSSATLYIKSPLVIRSTTGNPADVIIKRSITDDWGHFDLFQIYDKDARLEGITLQGGSANGSISLGAVLSITEGGGTVENCIIEGARIAPNQDGGGMVYLNSENAVLNRCIIRDPAYRTTSQWAYKDNPLGIRLKKGTVANTLLYNLNEKTTGTYKKQVGAIYAAGAGAKVINCTIINCSGATAGGIRAITGSLVANTIIAGCTDIDAASETASTHVYSGNGTFLNCATDRLEAPINDSCILGTAEEFFRDYANLDLYPNKLLVNKGAMQDADGNALAYGALDYFGKDRVQMDIPDIGYLEVPGYATLIMIK